MVSRYAIVKDGVVVNLCLWDGDENKWTPPEGAVAVKVPAGVDVGWLYDGEKFKHARQPDIVEPESELFKVMRDPIQLAKLREALK